MIYIEKMLNNKTKLAILVLGVVGTILLLYCFGFGISGNDFWWHIKVGEWICENGKVPTHDIFSWYGMEKDISWTAHEWLADVFFYKVFQFSGEVGIYIFSIICAIVLALLVLFQIKKYVCKNFLISAIYFFMFCISLSLFVYGRPHIFSYFFLFIEMKLIYDFLDKEYSKKIYFIPIVACLWSNMHGGSSNLSYILCIAIIVSLVYKVKIGRIETEEVDKRKIKSLLIVCMLTFVGILVNPIGFRVLLYPYKSLSDNVMMTLISEWQAPDAKLIGNLVIYFFPIFLLTIGFVSENVKVKLRDIIMMLMFLFLFFRSARFIMLWYIAAPFYAFSYMPECKIKDTTMKNKKILFIIVSCVCIMCSGGSIVKVINKTFDASIIRKVLNDKMIEIIKEDNPERIFNDYNVGESLIYHDVEVFFDARADLYSAYHILEDGASLMYLEQGNSSAKEQGFDVEAVIEKYRFDGIVILKDRALYSYLISHEEKYKCIYEDEKSAYFKVEQ
ncbi:MAG: hypothetical protein UF228_10445 [Lachnospiraceae bacterium]|nr:hypothetical protein [Lachnospiraceae bacterium]